jgi:hypothetical protein
VEVAAVRIESESKVWTITVELDESAEETQAKATLEVGPRHYGGWGRARRNPADPDVPRVGEELAAARALSDLSHKLLDAAATEIEQWEGGPVHVHE